MNTRLPSPQRESPADKADDKLLIAMPPVLPACPSTLHAPSSFFACFSTCAAKLCVKRWCIPSITSNTGAIGT